MATVRVVVLDDDIVCLQLVERFFRGTTYDVSTYSSLDDAKTRLSDGNVDLLLVDYRMPGINGVEFLTEVMQGDSTPPRVCLWSSGMLSSTDLLTASKIDVEMYSKEVLRDREGFIQFCESQLEHNPTGMQSSG